MLKLPLMLLVLIGSCATQDPSLSQLQGSSRVLIVFAPDSNSPAFQQQMQLIERHSFELSLQNTVVVPVSSSKLADQHYSFENVPLDSAREQAAARSRFHVRPSDFEVILLNQNGTERMRSSSPVDIHMLMASLDQPPMH